MDLRIGARGTLLLVCAFSACQCDDEALFETRAELVVEPVRVDFGEVLRGEFRVRALRLSNVGTAPLSLRPLELQTATGEFLIVSTPPASLLGNQSIDVSVLYEPADLGLDAAMIIVASDDGAAPTTVELVGVGVDAGARVEGDGPPCPGEPGSMAFGDVGLGDRETRSIVVTATGAGEIRVLGTRVESASAEWSIDGITTALTLGSGESLTIDARYAPVDIGADRATFIVQTEPPARSFRVDACGRGVGPALCARPVPLDFGLVPIGGVVTATLTLESCGTRPLALSAIAIATDAQHPSDPGYRLSTQQNLPTNLAPGATLDVPVELRAGNLGQTSGWMRVDSDADPAASYFPIEARIAEPCDVFVAPAAVQFTGVAVGAMDQRSVLIANDGASVCTVSRIAIATGTTTFALVQPPTTPLSLGPGESEIVSVEYAPFAAGMTDQGTLEIESGGRLMQVMLTGNPPEDPECAIEIVPSVVGFGVVALGTTARRGVQLRPIGESACRIESARLVMGNPDFALTAPTIRIILPIRSASIDLAFSPSRAGPAAEVLEVVVSALGGGPMRTYTAGLFGAGSDAQICVVPTDIRFGTVPIGSFVERPVQIANCGSAGLILRGLVLTAGGPFSIATAPALPHPLGGGASASPGVVLRYTPTDAGPHFAQLDVLSTDPNTPVVPVTLSGNWESTCDRALDCTPASIDFGPTDLGTTRRLRLRCRSVGTSTVTITAVNLPTGTTPEVSIVTRTPVSLSRGAAVVADVRYTPATTSSISAALQIVSDACFGPTTRAITGHGRRPVKPPCQPPMSFSPVTQWEWSGSNVEPAFRNVWMTPIVASMTDDNADGRIDDRDVPDVLVTTFDLTPPLSDPTASLPGILRVLSGDTGREIFAVTSPRVAESAQLAVGDLDADGFPEIVASRWIPTPAGTGSGSLAGRYRRGRLMALDHTGRLLWESDEWSWPDAVLWNASAPAIADLDGDGFAEIVLGRDVFDYRGRLLWRGSAGQGNSGAGPQSVVADIDLDGRPEVIAGNSAYHADGSLMWQATDAAGRRLGDGGVSIGMLDPTDPYPHIALDAFNSLYVLDHTGTVQWSVAIANRGPSSVLPVIADFDGDGDPDIAIADGDAVRVYAGTGGEIWSAVVSDSTCCPGISAFDFEGDGAYELLLNDYGSVYVYRGATGQNIFTAPRLNVTNYEVPVVADVDGDGRAEIIVALYNGRSPGGGVRVYSNVRDNWVTAPRIWNQQAFHVSNVTESGAIPLVETPIPQGPQVFRGTAATCE